MSVDLNSTPTNNSLNLRITFLLNGKAMGTLNVGEAETLSFRFNAIGVGTSQPLTLYTQETPGDFTIHPGYIAFIDRSVHRKIALRYGRPNETQQNIVFTMPE